METRLRIDPGFKVIPAILIIALLPLAFPPKASGWGSIWFNQKSTHVYILNEAHRLLRQDPAYEHGCFLPRTGVLSWEGIGASQRSGRGPDRAGATVYSDHYYNPKMDLGGAPKAAEVQYRAMLEGLGRGGGRKALKGAAWAAHFLADMRVPYHVQGAPLNWARQAYQAAGGETATKLPLPKKVMGSIRLGHLEVQRPNDFLKDIRKYFKHRAKVPKFADWFDPWYYNGQAIATSSHVLWEIQAYPTHGGPKPPERLAWDSYENLPTRNDGYWAPENGRDQGVGSLLDRPETIGNSTKGGFYNPMEDEPPPEQTPMARPIPKNPDKLVFGKNIPARAKLIEQFVKDVALATSNLTGANPDWARKHPKALINSAVKDVYLMWRSAISALKPFLTMEPDPDEDGAFKVRTSIKNMAAETVQGVRLRIRAEGARLEGPEELDVGPIGAKKLRRISTRWKLKNTRPGYRVTFEVVGRYRQTPDLQYAKLEKQGPKVGFPRVYEGPATISHEVRLLAPTGKCRRSTHILCKEGRVRTKVSLMKDGRATITMHPVKCVKNDGSEGLSCTPCPVELRGGLTFKGRHDSRSGVTFRVRPGLEIKYRFTDLALNGTDEVKYQDRSPCGPAKTRVEMALDLRLEPASHEDDFVTPSLFKPTLDDPLVEIKRLLE